MNLPVNASVPAISDVAQRLRQVKEAYRNFLSLWAAERMADDVEAMDRLADGMDDQLREQELERAIENPFNHNWSLLYRGSVLDD